MILYNVTVNVDDVIHEEWLEWMQTEHLPDVMRTGHFQEYRFFKLLQPQAEAGTTYAMQYFAPTMQAYETYRDTEAPRLQQATQTRFGGQFTAFRTLLEVVV